jgi:hypothetical protein
MNERMNDCENIYYLQRSLQRRHKAWMSKQMMHKLFQYHPWCYTTSTTAHQSQHKTPSIHTIYTDNVSRLACPPLEEHLFKFVSFETGSCQQVIHVVKTKVDMLPLDTQLRMSVAFIHLFKMKQ